MPQRFLIAGHLIIEAVSLLGIGVGGFVALAMSSPEVDTDKLGYGSGQYVLAVWVLFMIAAVATLSAVIRSQYKDNRNYQDLIAKQQKENQDRFIAYMEKAHAERDVREAKYAETHGDVSNAMNGFTASLKAICKVTEQCHDKHVMIEGGHVMASRGNGKAVE